jgi:hypothetical protein
MTANGHQGPDIWPSAYWRSIVEGRHPTATPGDLVPEFRLFADGEMAARTSEITDTAAAAIAAGVPQEEALKQMTDASADLLIARTTDHMQQQGPLAVARRLAGSERLAGIWGAALDAYYTVTVAAIELGALYSQRRAEAQVPADRVSSALALLHARTCQTSLEVHALLAAGFPGGAYGRYRTLHELAVTTAVIAEHGRTPEHADLADRYLDHTHIEHYQQARHFQRSSSHLGWQPFSRETMRTLKNERDRLITRYGPDYAQPYGWAAGLIRPPLTFERLEAKANMNLLRYFYVTGSHLVHATAHGLRMTLAPAQDGQSAVVIAGPSDAGLCQPARASLNALLDVTGGLVLHGGNPEDLSCMVNFAALGELRNRTLQLFDEAEDRRPT